MKRTLALLAAAAVCVPVAVSAQYSNYIGQIPTNTGPLALATDGTALYYVTFDEDGSGACGAYKIDDPNAVIETPPAAGSPAGTAIVQYAGSSPFPAIRGLQGIQVDSTGNIYISGEVGAAPAFVKKFASTFVEDTTFGTNTAALSERISGCALVGDDVLALQSFGAVHYVLTADGLQTGLTTPASGQPNYHREPVFNSADNVIYSMRNGVSSAEMVAGYISGVSTATGGGTWNASSLVADGALDTAFGSAQQHGHYDATNAKLVTVDQKTPPSDSEVRFWTPGAGGTTLTQDAALTISGTNTTPVSNWVGVSDVVIVGTRAYVTSVADSVIYVFDENSSVQDWTIME